MPRTERSEPNLPEWVPQNARHYLAHTEAGQSIRALARRSGQHASTIMRQIRKIETRRDDPLMDTALRKLGAHLRKSDRRVKATACDKESGMKAAVKLQDPDQEPMSQEVLRVLRRLCEKGAVLAVATDMERAVVVREGQNGASQRTAIVDQSVAEALALKEWIAAKQTGRVTRYSITAAGRQALESMLERSAERGAGFSDVQEDFSGQREMGEKRIVDPESGRSRNHRYNLSESPLTALARRRDKDGTPFISEDLVGAGERLREDFELAQMGPRIAQNWDRFLTGGSRGGFGADSGVGNGPEGARARVAAALAALGPGLGDVALRCCCYLEGLESAEKRLGWSARSGKIVLRIALSQLRRHYEEVHGPGGGLIG